MMRTPARRGGFTLIEILLAISVLSIVLLLLLSSFNGAVRVREALTSRSRDYRQIRLVLDRFGTDLEGAFATPYHTDSGLTLKEDQFSGLPAATLVFTAFQLPDGDDGRPPAEVVKVKYFPRIGTDGVTLELHREQSDSPFIENRIVPREYIMAEGLRGFRVELYDGSAWVKEWPSSGGSKSTMPKKAAITLVDARGDTYRREIIIPLAGQEPSLAYSGRRRVIE